MYNPNSMDNQRKNFILTVCVSVIATLFIGGAGLHFWQKNVLASVRDVIASETQKTVHDEIVSLAGQAMNAAAGSGQTADTPAVIDCAALLGSWSRFTMNEDFYLSICYKNEWGSPAFVEENDVVLISFPERQDLTLRIALSADADGTCWSCLNPLQNEMEIAGALQKASGKSVTVKNMLLRQTPVFRVVETGETGETLSYFIPNTLNAGKYHVTVHAALSEIASTAREAATVEVNDFIASFDF